MLVDISRAAEILCMTEGAAEKLLSRLKVDVIDFGPGRGMGKRWLIDDIKIAILSLKPKEAREHVQHRRGGRKKQTPEQDPILSLSAKQFVAEFTELTNKSPRK